MNGSRAYPALGDRSESQKAIVQPSLAACSLV